MNIYDVHLTGKQVTEVTGIVHDIQAESEAAARKIAMSKDRKYCVNWKFQASQYEDVVVSKVEVRNCPVVYDTAFWQKFHHDRKQFALGELISKLEMLDPATLIKLMFSEIVTNCTSHSYRGYYEQLAIYPKFDSGSPLCVAPFVRFLKTCLGHTYTGWKGGEYTMGETTPVWVSDQGESSGVMLVGLELNTTMNPPILTLLTSMEDS